ncbi:hypothetical protein ACHAXR_006071, partial [Thalassiosira sp. AJA248-18]
MNRPDAEADAGALKNNGSRDDGDRRYCQLQLPSMERSAAWPVDSQCDDAAKKSCNDNETSSVEVTSLHENSIMKGNNTLTEEMSKVGSDDWSNFIVIDRSSSQGSLGNCHGLNSSAILYQRGLIASPTNVTDFASSVAEADTNESAVDPEKRQITEEVCRLLGLPSGTVANHPVRVKIMSSNTEHKLRELVKRDIQENQGEKPAGSVQTRECFAFTADQFPPNIGSGLLSPQTGEDSNAKDEPRLHRNNILTEGEYYLAMSMLVYIYALLREASVLGHTAIGFDDIDVNSFGSSCLGKTKSAGFIIRVVMDEVEKNGSLLGSVGRNESDVSIMKEFHRLVLDSRVPVDPATEKTMKKLRRKVARRRWKRAISAVRLIVKLGSRTKNSIQEDKALKEADQIHADGWRAQTVTGPMNSPKRSNSISTVVEAIAHDTLDEPSFFREGSLMSNLIESGIEVVLFDDRHPNDVVYSICCNRKTKCVSVVFRGTVNYHNWLMNTKISMSEHPNPVAEDYPGREDIFGLHTGYALYMLRQRKDNELTKIEQIFHNIDSVGRELAAPDGSYELSITGHSLGGALATITAFYAASSDVFAKVKTIRAFTYAAPRVGCQRFAHAFQYLERKGRLRMARFSNTCDIVPLVPFCSANGYKIGRPYKHVGVHVRLHGVNKFAQYRLRQALDVTYPKHQDLWSKMRRCFSNSLVANLNTIQGYGKSHSLSAYQMRIHFALKYRSALSLTDFFRCSKRNRLKTLDEYYFIKGASSESGTAALTKILLENREKESYRRKTRKVVIGLLVIVLLQATVVLNLFREVIISPPYSRTRRQSEKRRTTHSAGIKSFPTTFFISRIKFTPKDTRVIDSTTKFSSTLPY